jgi:hypothetical protein
MTRFTLSMLCLIAQAATVLAQDQVEMIADPPQPVPAAGSVVNVNNATLLAANAAVLLQNTVLAGNAAPLSDPNFYCIIHVVKWREQKEPAVQAHNWYVFRGGNSAPQQLAFESKRIYGSRRVAVLWVHIVPRLSAANVAIVTSALLASNNTNWDDPANRQAVVDGIQPPPANAAMVAAARAPNSSDAATLSALKQWLAQEQANHLYRTCFSSQYTDSLERKFSKVGTECFADSYLRVAYRMEITKKLPAPVQNAAMLLGAQAGGGRSLLAPEPGLLWSGRILDIHHVPSDMTVKGTLTNDDGSKTTEIGQATFDNEGLYRWDVSVAVPLKATKELQYDATGQGFNPTAKVVEKQNVYAVFNFFTQPLDVKNVKAQWVPHPIFGMGIAGRPADRTMVGFAMGINKIQGFGGLAFNRVQRPAGTAAGQPAKTEFAYDRKFIFGINLPVRQVLELWKAKK